MTHAPTDPRFTWADLEHWTGLGLLRPEQLTAIRAHLTEDQVSRVQLASASASRERPAGLNLVTVAYYFGAFIILLAGTIFVGLQWEDLGRPGQFAASWGAAAGLWVLGAWLRRAGHGLGGNLLIFAGTGIVPLGVYTLLRVLNLWPDSADAASYQAFYRTIDAAWLLLEVASIAVTLAVIWLTRFPLLTLLLAFWSWYLSMDRTELIAGHDDFAWGPPEWTVGALVGVAMLALGAWQQHRHGGQDWSRWFYLFGHVALLGNLAALALGDDLLPGVLFLAVYVGFVVASVWLQSRMFLVFGAIGCYAYVAKLAFDVFDRSLGFTLVLGIVGLLIVLATVAYERYVQPWLEQRFHARPASASAAGSAGGP
jgi:hypothetical protein